MNYLVLILCFFGSIFFLTKIIDWIAARRVYSDVKSEFVSDLYKLQLKYSKKGEFGFSNSIGMLISSWTQPEPVKKVPITELGRRVQEEYEED